MLIYWDPNDSLNRVVSVAEYFSVSDNLIRVILKMCFRIIVFVSDLKFLFQIYNSQNSQDIGFTKSGCCCSMIQVFRKI